MPQAVTKMPCTRGRRPPSSLATWASQLRPLTKGEGQVRSRQMKAEIKWNKDASLEDPTESRGTSAHSNIVNTQQDPIDMHLVREGRSRRVCLRTSPRTKSLTEPPASFCSDRRSRQSACSREDLPVQSLVELESELASKLA